nr:hypothetical protein [Acetobacter conturbans]
MGIGIGLLMTSWCLSGMVMLWRPWPIPDPAAGQGVHGPLHLPAQLPPIAALTEPEERFQSFRLGMTGEAPVLTLVPVAGAPFAVDLRTGQRGGIAPEDAGASAQAYAAAVGVQERRAFEGTTTDDQWVLDTPGRMGGFERFRFPGPRHLVVYVSPLTGDVTQATDTTSRAWAWVGAIPHWLYPAALRRHPPAWKWTVIILSGTGMFLTVTGLVVGLLRLRKRWPFSHYHRWHLVHHLGGLVFGLLALSWIATGFLTMNPGGAFESRKETLAPLHVTGSMTGREVFAVLDRVLRASPADWTDVRSVLLNGRIFLAVTARDRHRQRLDASLSPAPLAKEALGQSALLLTEPDQYYFDRPLRKRPFPVFRLSTTDGTLFYLDACSGEVLAAFDRPARQSRWMVYGLHDMDVLSWLRTPTARLMIVFPCLCGVCLIFLSGIVIGVKYLRAEPPRNRSGRM